MSLTFIIQLRKRSASFRSFTGASGEKNPEMSQHVSEVLGDALI